MTDSVALCFAAEHVPVTRACHELEHLKLFMMTGLSAQAATEVRKEVNKLDNQTTGKAIDALLNFETVALFNNQVPQPPPEHLGLYTFPHTPCTQFLKFYALACNRGHCATSRSTP